MDPSLTGTTDLDGDYLFFNLWCLTIDIRLIFNQEVLPSVWFNYNQVWINKMQVDAGHELDIYVQSCSCKFSFSQAVGYEC